jgi:hypothetical protein
MPARAKPGPAVIDAAGVVTVSRRESAVGSTSSLVMLGAMREPDDTLRRPKALLPDVSGVLVEAPSSTPLLKARCPTLNGRPPTARSSSVMSDAALPWAGRGDGAEVAAAAADPATASARRAAATRRPDTTTRTRASF